MKVSKPLQIVNLLILILTVVTAAVLIASFAMILLNDFSIPDETKPSLGESLLAIILTGLTIWAALGIRKEKKNAVLLAFGLVVYSVGYGLIVSFSQPTSLLGMASFIPSFLYGYLLFDCIKKNDLIKL